MNACSVPRWLLAGLAACLLTACGRPPAPQSISWQTTPAANDPLRIAVLPLVAVAGVGRTANTIDESLLAALRILGKHEVVPVANDRARELLPASAMENSEVSGADLLRLRDALHVDAVVVGRIDQFQSYDPVSLGLTVHLVSVNDGTVLWSATAHLDSGRSDVQNDVRYWYENANGTGNISLTGWRLALSSPTLFSRYVADRLVETLVVKP
jgi:hypothetical protein